MFRKVIVLIITFALITSCKKSTSSSESKPEPFCVTVKDAETNNPIRGVIVDVGISGYHIPQFLYSDSLGHCCTSQLVYKNEFISGIALTSNYYMPETFHFTASNKPPEILKMYKGKYIKIRMTNMAPANSNDFMWICCPPFLQGFWGAVDTTIKFMVYPHTNKLRFLSNPQHSENVQHNDSMPVSFAQGDTMFLHFKY